ncbi:hypothetical protein GW765_04275 [Candidatus Parcubacteria bacterium]|nr:hypothetical protein [Candidatus Parcubacteria bacterium]
METTPERAISEFFNFMKLFKNGEIPNEIEKHSMAFTAFQRELINSNNRKILEEITFGNLPRRISIGRSKNRDKFVIKKKNSKYAVKIIFDVTNERLESYGLVFNKIKAYELSE